ncbi:Sorbitol dehydrogenase [Camponotus floridanus]|uniref:Sorbitol dehydrogenase n=1 Tax=Camponotus floridanus TaxID=104421 RepID=E2A460_CAMFO|nr:Sorbitol dehydrogenase [Camponotus floridanus]
MTKDNLSAILYAVNDLRLENTSIEEPEDNEVLLEMGCVGICGSDVHYLVNGRIGDFILKKPMIIGHESSGTVAKLGKNVKNLKVGDRVGIEPGVPCRICNFCKEGRYNLCKDIVFCATPPVHGSLRRFYKHAADFCFKLPDHVSLEEGALLEPLSVAVHACKRGEISINSKVLILGAGPIGLVTLLVAKAMGANKVVITDILENRLKMAKKLGADDTYLLQKDKSEKDVVADIHAIFDDEPNRTVDASGAQASIRLAILVSFKIYTFITDYNDALELIASGRVNVKPLITHNYKIEDTKQAFETSRTGAGGAIKVMIHCK